jgi:MATE family multidrug resistance protein
VFDGIFVALTRGKAMQNSMLISSALFFFPTWWWLAHYGNNALWMALLTFLLARGGTLAVYFVHLVRTGKILE